MKDLLNKKTTIGASVWASIKASTNDIHRNIFVYIIQDKVMQCENINEDEFAIIQVGELEESVQTYEHKPSPKEVVASSNIGKQFMEEMIHHECDDIEDYL